MTKENAFRLLGLVVCCVLLAALLTSGAQARSIGPYEVEGGVISGGGYHLTTVEWQVSGTASGREYRLVGPAPAGPTGSGCCCTYLPCVMRDW